MCPIAAKHPCTHPGCPALVPRGHAQCPEHERGRRRSSDAERGSAAERGYGPAWRAARASFLAAHPACATCGAPASVVDHVRAHKGDQALFWDRANWQPLCASCHSRKTAEHDGGFGNAVTP